MRKFLAALLLAAPLCVAADPDRSDKATVHHRFTDAEQWAEAFEAPDRYDWQRPWIVVRVLNLVEGQRVADLGAGTGYFTKLLSSAVGETGKVWAVDVEPSMLEYIERREDLPPYDNVVTVLAAADDPKLPDNELDLVLVVNTWHHIDDRVRYLGRLARTLHPGGRVAIIDWREGELPKGPPPGMKLPRDQVVEEFERAGWRLVTESMGLPYQYFLVFLPPGLPARNAP